MESLFLSPHNDDAVLFGTFTLLREKPLVVTCFRSVVQEVRGLGITSAQREAEDDAAFAILDVDHVQWPFPDIGDGGGMGEAFRELAGGYDRVYAPAYEEGGHEQHNQIGLLAAALFGPLLTPYLTYTRAGGKSEGRNRVNYEPEWVTLKLRAMACYRSQIETGAAGCTEHFVRDLREYYAR